MSRALFYQQRLLLTPKKEEAKPVAGGGENFLIGELLIDEKFKTLACRTSN